MTGKNSLGIYLEMIFARMVLEGCPWCPKTLAVPKGPRCTKILRNSEFTFDSSKT